MGEPNALEVDAPRKGMHVGAIAMIDALAFQGIWDLFDADAVFETMEHVKTIANHAARSVTASLAQFAGPGRLAHAPQGTSLCLSDTIVFALHIENFEPETLTIRIETIQSALTAYVVHAVANMIAVASHGPVHLNYRGAITWGEFRIHDNYLLGPAVDEVATLHQQPDAAGVLLTRAAGNRILAIEKHPGALPKEFRPPLLCFEHQLPLKSGATDACAMVVNPFAGCTDRKQLHDVQDGMKRAFRGSQVDSHLRKFRNTMELTSAAAKGWATVRG